MDENGRSAAAPPAGEVLEATGERLRRRRDELAPLVADWERIGEIEAAFGELPAPIDGPHEDGSASHLHAEIVGELDQVRTRLQERSRTLELLVREHDRILHVLAAFESADALPHDPGARRRRPSPRRSGAPSAAAQARHDTLRGLLAEPRSRAELAERMSLSPSRVTELLEPLARAGEVVEIPDPARANRKLWALARNGAPDAEHHEDAAG
jgi:hypothetical protein